MIDVTLLLALTALVAWHEARGGLQTDAHPQVVPEPTPASVECPHCDCNLAPEEVAPNIWFCACCSSMFKADAPSQGETA